MEDPVLATFPESNAGRVLTTADRGADFDTPLAEMIELSEMSTEDTW